MPALVVVREERPTYAGVFRVSMLTLCWGSSFGRFLAITLVKAIDASCGIDQLLFSGKERVAGRANFDVQIALLGRAGLESFATSTANGYFDVFGVNSWFHYFFVTLHRRPKAAFSNVT